MSTENSRVLDSATSGSPKLTPAASEALNVSAENFRLQILREISRVHAESGYRARISDVENAIGRVTLRSSTGRLVPRITLLALALAAISLVAQLGLQVSKADQTWLISFASLLVGASTGAGVLVIIQESRRRKRDVTLASREFLQAFADLELTARREVAELLGDQTELVSLARVISAVELLHLWTPEDSQVFRTVLGLRNHLVHEEASAPSPESISLALSQIARLSSLLDRSNTQGIRGARQGRYGVSALTKRALAYEERIVYLLRQASFDVISAPNDVGYDLLVETPHAALAIIVKYYDQGTLTRWDILAQASKISSTLPLVVIANAPLRDLEYVNTNIQVLIRQSVEFLSKSAEGRHIEVISWPETGEAKDLLEGILGAGISAAAEHPGSSTGTASQ